MHLKTQRYQGVRLVLLLLQCWCGVWARSAQQQHEAELVDGGAAPHFKQPETLLPHSVTANRGSTVKLNCSVAADGQRFAPNITWSWSGEAGGGGASLAERQAAGRQLSYDKWSLLMWDVRAGDAGAYECRVCNRFGCIAHRTALVVLDDGADDYGDDDDDDDDGDDDGDASALMTTTAASTSTSTSTTSTSTTRATTSATPMAVSATLDAGAAPKAEDGDGESGDVAPTFKNDHFKNVHKLSGNTITLNCPANGVPTPSVRWTLNDTEIQRRFGAVHYRRWSITFSDAIVADSGNYSCHVCNRAGCIVRSTNVVVVDRLRTRPIMSDKYPQNRTVLVNGTAELECRFTSDLEPFIRWIRFHERNISAAQTELYVPMLGNNSNYNSTRYTMLPYDNTPIINLTRVTHADEGWYTCIVASTLGQAWARAYVRVVDTLPTPKFHTVIRSHPIWNTLVPIVVIVFVLGTGFIVYVLRRLKQERLLKHRIEMVHQWTKKVIIYRPGGSDGSLCELQMPVIKIEKQRTTFQTSGGAGDSAQPFNEYEFPLDANWEIPRAQLTLGCTLGEGAFGRVVRAEACSLQTTSGQSLSGNGNGATVVAVKMVKEEHTDADMASLVREMEVMKMIGKHINIINLLGCCSQNGPLWVIVEFAPHGNLKDFLKRNRPLYAGGPMLLSASSCLAEERHNSGDRCSGSGGGCEPFMAPLVELTEKKLISFAFQIARGMEYLASRRCIHRDLAARNVLVSDDYVLKIADFGLARDIQDTDYYRKNTNGRLPIKWMAPESLQEKFYDSQSDVWSYGVLLWEIMTYGEQPYPNVICAEELYSYLITGQRMEKPARCSLNIYMLMRQCWHFDGCARPTFTELVENLDKILQLANSMANEDYLDLSMPMLETPPSSSDEENDDGDDAYSLDGNMDIDVIDGAATHGSGAVARHPLGNDLMPQRYQYTYKFNNK